MYSVQTREKKKRILRNHMAMNIHVYKPKNNMNRVGKNKKINIETTRSTKLLVNGPAWVELN